MSLDKLFKNIEKTSETTLTEEFKESITEAVKIATAEKEAKISELESANETLVTENEELKSEIEKLREAYDESTRKNVELTTEMEKINSTVTLMEKCDGLTEYQKKKMVVIFKGKSEEEINERFDEVRDMVVESTTKTDRNQNGKDVKPVVTEKVVAEAKKDLINESEEDLGQKYI